MYDSVCRDALAREGMVGADPRHLEAWMRLEYGTLDARSASDFRHMAREMRPALVGSYVSESETLAVSFGL